MKITVKISRSNDLQRIDLKSGSKVQDVLTELNMKPDTLIVMKENVPIPLDNELKCGEELTIIQVSSGG
jgi:sulfur carrier protein ThiS